jgi:hypothetical protein
LFLPTAAASSYGSNRGGAAGRVGRERPSLETLFRRGTATGSGFLPTLTVSGNTNAAGANEKSGSGLGTVVSRASGYLPTVTTAAGTGGYAGDDAAARPSKGGHRRGHQGNELLRRIHKAEGYLPPPLASDAGGPLNPPWLEWFMGFPIGWTEPAPLETQSCRRWLRTHSPSSLSTV